MRETRSTVLLVRLAKKLREETGDKRYRAKVEETRESLRRLIWISCTRPIRKSDFVYVFIVWRLISNMQTFYALNQL